MAKKSTALSKVPPKKVPAQAAGSFARFLDPDIGTGLENVTADDLLIPRLTILQKLSPQVDETKPLFDPKARVGMIYDVGLQQGFGNQLHILPVHFVKQWLEWGSRKSGKGLVAIHSSKDILGKTKRDEKNRPMMENGNYIAETAQFYCLNLDAKNRRSFLPMASTQLKRAKRLITLSTQEKLIGLREDGSEFEFPAPLYYRTYKLGTMVDANAEGSWISWTVDSDISIDELPDVDNLMEEVKDFRAALTKGDIRGDISSLVEETGKTIDHEEPF
jgi:hypothetical protein